ncbi:replication protein A [Klebsiella quasipneumoniae]|nr:replication protein A [Klebsiella quasipneumoniae]
MNKPKSLDKFSRACSISDFALSIGLDLSYSLIEDLLEGKHLRFNDRTIYAILTGELRTVEVGSKDVQIRQLHTILKKKIKIILQKLNIIQ